MIILWNEHNELSDSNDIMEKKEKIYISGTFYKIL